MYKYIRYIYTIHHVDNFFLFFPSMCARCTTRQSPYNIRKESIHTGTRLLEDERMRDAAAPGRGYVSSRTCKQIWRTHLHSGRKTEMQ